LESTFSYNNEGKQTATTYPSTVCPPPSAPNCGHNNTGASYNYSYDAMYRLSRHDRRQQQQYEQPA